MDEAKKTKPRKVLKAVQRELERVYADNRSLRTTVEKLETIHSLHKELQDAHRRRERSESYRTTTRHMRKTRRLRRVVDHFRRKWMDEKGRCVGKQIVIDDAWYFYCKLDLSQISNQEDAYRLMDLLRENRTRPKDRLMGVEIVAEGSGGTREEAAGEP